METIIRRSVTVVLFIISYFGGVILFEMILYFSRRIVTGKPFPKDPYSFTLLKRMW